MHNPYKDFSKVDPQREDGHRRIENSVFQALVRADLPGIEYSLVLCVLDKTWGFGKKEDVIPLSQFADATLQDRSNIRKALQSLSDKHIILINNLGPGRGKGNIYMFNKYWDTWKIDKWLPTPQLAPNVVEGTTFTEPPETPEEMLSPAPQLASNVVERTTKGNVVESTTKEGENVVKNEGNVVTPDSGKCGDIHPLNRKRKKHSKERGDINTPSSDAMQLAQLLKNLMLNNNPKAKIPDDLTRWALDIDKMIRLDNRTPPEIKAIIEFSQRDSFWCSNILSAGKLREKFDQLYLKAREKEKSSAEKKERGESYGTGGERQPGRGSPAHQQEPGKSDRFSGFKPIRSGTGEPDDGEED